MVHLFRKVHFLPKDLRFKHEGAKLSSCPERHITSLHPWHSSRLIKQIWVEKKRSGSPGPKAFWRNLKGTFEDLLPCYCCAVQTNSRTIREQGAQPAPTGKGEGTSELQSHHCMAPEQWTWLLSSVIVSVIYRQTNCHCNNLVNYSEISC